MTCGIVTCAVGEVHHHHKRRDGALLAHPCMCTRPTQWLQPVAIEKLIDFAAAHPGKVDGHVDEQIRQELGITTVRYLQLLARAIHTEEALAHDSLTTYRLRREADTRARAREARTTRR